MPADAKTIQAGVDRAAPGDLVLVSPGVYQEAVTVGTDGIVLRGVDRNRTILDGEFERENGVNVVGADGVAVENLTARNFTENGFFWNGVLGYRGSYLTAYRNGDYGVYAFDSQYGQFEHSYASGSPDSGFYIGQCNPCHAVITDVVAEYNQLGYSGSNASGDLLPRELGVVAQPHRHRARTASTARSSRPRARRRSPATWSSDNGDAAAARDGTTRPSTPRSASASCIAGGIGNVITKNRVADNAQGRDRARAERRARGRRRTSRPGNRVTDNVVEGSGLADLAIVLRDAADGNCFSGNTFSTSAPANIEQVMPCDGAGTGDLATGARRHRRVPRHVEEPARAALQEDAGPGEAAQHAEGGSRRRRDRRARRSRSISPRSRCRPAAEPGPAALSRDRRLEDVARGA